MPHAQHSAGRWFARLVLLIAMSLIAGGAVAATCVAANWPLWNDFKQHFIKPDGRVVDASTPQVHSSSEGQSYGMFFALIANDQPTFDRLWRWSVNNLAGGDSGAQLPGWLWGRADDGAWRLLDPNAASDADLWFVYDLLEAGRLWGRPDYVRDAMRLLALIEQKEIVSLPGLGAMLLPGPIGFEQPNKVWLLNPSYLPIPLLRRLTSASPTGPWASIAANTARMITSVTPKGLIADWVGYQVTSDTAGRFIIDPVKGDRGSYDAIRVYLWAGMTPNADPLATKVRNALTGMNSHIASFGYPPESVVTLTGATAGTGPFGFSAALVPYLRAIGKTALAEEQLQRARRLQAESLLAQNLAQRQPPYFDYVLSLFGVGWADGFYSFKPNGSLQIRWQNPCNP